MLKNKDNYFFEAVKNIPRDVNVTEKSETRGSTNKPISEKKEYPRGEGFRWLPLKGVLDESF